jgi:hypothetical protein
VTYSVHCWHRVHRYGGLSTGAGGCSLHLGERRRVETSKVCEQQILNLAND